MESSSGQEIRVWGVSNKQVEATAPRACSFSAFGFPFTLLQGGVALPGRCASPGSFGRARL
jgi:hypothetical protein